MADWTCKPLISHRFGLEQTEAAYAVVGGSEPSMGILLEYPTRSEKADSVLREPTVRMAAQAVSRPKVADPAVAFVGSGNYATGVLIPAFKAAGAHLASVASSAGVSGVHAAKKYGFDETTTDTDSLFADPKVDALVITTRHNSHAGFVLQALAAGKHVFVEKPICLTLAELDEIEAAHARLEEQGKAPLVMVGFNRRFAPQVQKIKSLLAGVNGPKSFVMTVNAGAIPADHWTQDRELGGGRIVGEGCHFIDLLRFLAASPIVAHSRLAMDSATGDTVTLQLGFADGSIGTVHYFANGCKAFPKERLEVFAAGRVLQLDNFRKLKAYAWPGFKSMNLWSQDKGQKACAAAFVKAIADGGMAPIPFAEIVEASRVSIELAGA
jgi:predicted dehydrogenase